MKYNISSMFYFLVVIASSVIMTMENTQEIIVQKKQSSERAENAKFVLANIAQMIGQIGTIVEQPHNADNVGNAVTNIVNNIVKITVHAVQNKTIKQQEADNVIQLIKDICKNIELDENIDILLSKNMPLI